MKKIFVTLLFAWLSIPAFAMVQPGYQNEGNMALSYPLVYTVNSDAQEKINTDIAGYVDEAKESYYNGLHQVKLSYVIKYEDDHIISILLTELKDGGGVHPLEHYYGLVYDKDTGDRVPISNFVTIGSLEQWQQLAGTQTFPAYDRQWQQITLMRQPTRISDDYYLPGQGVVCMIYQPYEVAAYANGMISIVITPSAVEYLNQLNNGE